MKISLSTIKDTWMKFQPYVLLFLAFLLSIVVISILLLRKSVNEPTTPAIVNEYGDIFLQPGTVFSVDTINRAITIQDENESYISYYYPSSRDEDLFSIVVVNKENGKILEIQNPITLQQNLTIKEIEQRLGQLYKELFFIDAPNSSILRIYETEGLAFEHHEKGRVRTIIHFDNQELDNFYQHWYEQSYVPKDELPTLEEQSYELPYDEDTFIREDATPAGETNKEFLR